MRPFPVALFSLLPLLRFASPLLATAVPAHVTAPTLTAACLGSAAAGAPARIAVRWSGDRPLAVTVWSDLDGDRDFDLREPVVAAQVIEPGYTVIEIESAPGAPMVVGAQAGSAPGAPAVPVEGCEWSSGFFFADLDGTVRAFATYDDGTGSRLYVAGDFVAAADQVVNHIAAWDGSSWAPLPGPGGHVGADATVRALTVYAGSLYVGGDFTAAGGLAAAHVARWNASGWSNVGDIDGPVHALLGFQDITGTRLYAGGEFQHAGGVAVSNFARRSGTTWESVGTTVGGIPGVDGPVYALERCTNGGFIYQLFVGGSFASTAAGTAHNIARWNGSSWGSVGAGDSNGVSGTVRALECAGGVLYVGGVFVDAGNGIFSQGIASWSGTAWSALDNGMFFETGASGQVWALGLYGEGAEQRLYAGGNFHYAGGQPASHVAVWSGSAWSGFIGPSNAGIDEQVFALGSFGAELYAGGSFDEAGGSAARHVARWSGAASENWRPLEDRWGQGFDDGAMALAVFDEGEGPRLFVGGLFRHVGNAAIDFLARWDGVQWSAVENAAGDSPDGWVRVLKVHDFGSGPKLYVGGSFSEPGRNVVAWDGTDWQILGTEDAEGTNFTVEDFQSFNSGAGPQLYVAGWFDAAGGITAHGIARWDGAEWHPLVGPFSPPDTLMDGAVHSLELFDDGGGPDLYVGGVFELSVTDARNLARWDGTGWSAVGAQGPDGGVGALAVHDDGSGPALYASGLFGHVGALEANNIARWDGSSWSALSGPAGNGTNATTWALVSYDDGDGPALYAGGPYSEAGGVPVGGLARFKDGAWSAVPAATGSDFDFEPWRLYTYDDGDGPALWVLGGFTRVGSRVSAHVARWSCGLLFKDGFESGDAGAWSLLIGTGSARSTALRSSPLRRRSGLRGKHLHGASPLDDQ